MIRLTCWTEIDSCPSVPCEDAFVPQPGRLYEVVDALDSDLRWKEL